MQPPPKALPPSHYKQVAPAKALCLAVAFEAMSEQPGGFKRTMGADPAPAEDEQGGCLSPPDDTLYVPGSSSEEQGGSSEAAQGGCLSPLAKKPRPVPRITQRVIRFIVQKWDGEEWNEIINVWEPQEDYIAAHLLMVRWKSMFATETLRVSQKWIEVEVELPPAPPGKCSASKLQNLQ